MAERLINSAETNTQASVVSSWGEASIQGKRWEMEDEHIIIPNFRSPQEFFAAVYDGHGGREVATYTLQHLHKYLDLALKESSPREALNKAFLLTDSDVMRAHIDAGSTAVVAYLNGNELYVANAGDSRAVLSRNGEAVRVSKDHKPEDPEEKERIEKLGGYVTTKQQTRVARVNGELSLSRSIGDHFFDDVFMGIDLISANPFIKKIDLEKDDDALILACDGVWDVMEDQEAIDLVRGILNRKVVDGPKGKIKLWDFRSKDAAEKLIDEALKKGSKDNITAIVLRLKP